ncbi:MAG TPA: ADP-ribosylglycohydrolase family protein [Spirochaetia bacterium]|nr:ADP-ribosylglycohydrolase family protein [Spirochaetia bacterium]
MIGAIIGDIAGSTYEFGSEKPAQATFFRKGSAITDDSILTVATARALLELRAVGKSAADSRLYYKNHYLLYGRRYPHAGYGQSFKEWLSSPDPRPYGSYGNGSAMRVSPIGYAFPTLKETLREAGKSAAVTHNHPDGIKGARAVAGAVFLAFHGGSKEDVRAFVENEIGYPLRFNLEKLHREYRFEIQCAKSVPQAVFAFLESGDFTGAVRNALYIGGDSDTISCIAGAIAGAYYKKIPEDIIESAMCFMDAEMKKTVKEFNEAFGVRFF